MAEETTEYKLFKDKREEMSTLFGRMDEDENLYFLSPYKMMRLDNPAQEMKGVANVTLNDPLIYTQKGIAILGGATRQTIVEGRDLSDKKTTKIEEFLDDVFYMIDEWLVKLGKLGLDAFVNEQLGIRGRLSARVCIRIDPAKGFVPDVLPIDTRYYVDDTDGQNLVWGGHWFTESKAQIEREYSKPGDRQVTLESESELVDFWNPEMNFVFADKQIIREQPNPYKEVNFVRTICPSGSTLNSATAKEHEGESLLWANRDLWQEKNRIMSILQTMTINNLYGGLQLETPDYKTQGKPKESPYEQLTIQAVPPGGGYKPIPMRDIQNATRTAYSILETCLQRGSLATIDYGTLTFPLSAIAITRLSGSRDDIFLPRIQAKALFYQALSKMIIKQCITLAETLELGKEGSTNSYTPADLDGDYTIKYRFYTETQEQMIANLSIANASQGYLSPDTIRRDVLKLKDPDGEKTKFLSEQAEMKDEVLFLYRRACELIEDEKPLEAYILAQRIVTILKQRQIEGNLIEAQGNPQPKGKPLMPLFAGGTQGSPMPTEPTQVAEVANG